MPSDIKQLTAGRQLTGLRQVLDCPATATTLRQGPAAAPEEPPDWLALLCPTHSEALPRWPGTVADTDGLRLPCGSVLDYRSAEQLLQSHADLWLTPLTGGTRRRTPGSGPTSWTKPTAYCAPDWAKTPPMETRRCTASP
ncbi:hypothetical protein ACFWWT_44120 [Streptomyces sp. NPDC058676]|uniref:hypothetical protein n=1 Tax=unclassified Streptomyces TaxID=2593676 RepID=UPI003663E5BB